MCRSAAFPGVVERNKEQHLVISFADATQNDMNIGMFTYRPDPVIQDVHPQKTILRYIIKTEWKHNVKTGNLQTLTKILETEIREKKCASKIIVCCTFVLFLDVYK